jgi:DNA-binding IclR family transcriptional regulator
MAAAKFNNMSHAKKQTIARELEDRHFVASLARGLAVLACFRSDSVLTNGDLALRCELPKSTISRLTGTLIRLGYLIQLEDSGKYRLGTASLALGSAMLTKLDVRQIARPWMAELAAQSRMDVTLAARDRNEMIFVEICRGQPPESAALQVGDRIPILTSAIGRAWLAVIDLEERTLLLDRIRDREPAAWPVTIRGLDRSFEEYRTLGVTCSFGEWLPYVNGIACAVHPGQGLPTMAISVGGLAKNFSPQFLLGEMRPRLIGLAQRIADATGSTHGQSAWLSAARRRRA